jgi:hypothetical protein
MRVSTWVCVWSRGDYEDDEEVEKEGGISSVEEGGISSAGEGGIPSAERVLSCRSRRMDTYRSGRILEF